MGLVPPSPIGPKRLRSRLVLARSARLRLCGAGSRQTQGDLQTRFHKAPLTSRGFFRGPRFGGPSCALSVISVRGFGAQVRQPGCSFTLHTHLHMLPAVIARSNPPQDHFWHLGPSEERRGGDDSSSTHTDSSSVQRICCHQTLGTEPANELETSFPSCIANAMHSPHQYNP